MTETDPKTSLLSGQAQSRLESPRDAAGLAAFRILFGALMVLAVIRFAAMGWIDELYVVPAYHFTYLGFDWVEAWPRWGMYAHFALMGCAALGLALGYRTRAMAAAFFLLFTYAELLDKSAYLNHYYLVSLLSLLLVIVPCSRVWSLDARRKQGEGAVPSWAYWLLRGQMALVYFYAGFAKVNEDWLLHAQPLTLWLSNYTDMPVFGALVETHWLPWVMSWSGMLYDLAVAPLLLWKRTRAFAFAAAVIFHVSVWLLFPIGIFPWVMLLGATIFFEPDWPRRVLRRLRTPEWCWQSPVGAAQGGARGLARTPRWLLAVCAAHLALQVAVPLRFLLYPGWVNWSEQGFRFAWRVMLIEKTGQVEFEVVAPETEQSFRIYPRRELSQLQFRMMSTQPDMIHQYALHLAERYQARGLGKVRVHADAWASLNGRPSQRMIDPNVDLAVVPRSLAPSAFIVPFVASGERYAAARATASWR